MKDRGCGEVTCWSLMFWAFSPLSLWCFKRGYDEWASAAKLHAHWLMIISNVYFLYNKAFWLLEWAKFTNWTYCFVCCAEMSDQSDPLVAIKKKAELWYFHAGFTFQVGVASVWNKLSQFPACWCLKPTFFCRAGASLEFQSNLSAWMPVKSAATKITAFPLCFPKTTGLSDKWDWLISLFKYAKTKSHQSTRVKENTLKMSSMEKVKHCSNVVN